MTQRNEISILCLQMESTPVECVPSPIDVALLANGAVVQKNILCPFAG
jgi:hypothetical protein